MDLVLNLKVAGVEVATVEKMKVLGIIFEYKLSWKNHIDELKKKITKVQNRIKLIRRKLNLKQS